MASMAGWLLIVPLDVLSLFSFSPLVSLRGLGGYFTALWLTLRRLASASSNSFMLSFCFSPKQKTKQKKKEREREREISSDYLIPFSIKLITHLSLLLWF